MLIQAMSNYLSLRKLLESDGFLDRCSEETACSAGTECVGRALEVLVNQCDWLRGRLTFRLVKRLKFSAVEIVGITLG